MRLSAEIPVGPGSLKIRIVKIRPVVGVCVGTAHNAKILTLIHSVEILTLIHPVEIRPVVGV